MASATHTGPLPATHTGPAPATHTGPTPATHTSPVPATHTGSALVAHPGLVQRPIPTPRNVPSPNTAGMDAYIEEILSQMPGVRPIPAPHRRRPTLAWPFTDLDDHVPHPVRLPPYEPWVEILKDTKEEFEIDGAAAVFSTWRVEGEDLHDISDIRSPMACVPELAGWRWTLGWPTRELPNFSQLSLRASSF